MSDVLFAQQYFETGCLCYLTGRMKRPEDSTVFEIVDYYMGNCKCSRHSETFNRDTKLEKIMRKEYKENKE